MISATSTNTEKLLVSLTVTTAPLSDGSTRPADVEGDVKWELLEGDVTIEVVEGTGGKEAVITAGTANTVNRISIKADADLGEGVSEITEELVYTVTTAPAAGFGAAITVASI